MKRQGGFTLIEVLVAAGILGIAASALFGLLSRSLFNLRKVEDLHRYELLAEDVMNRVLLSSALAPGRAEGPIENAGAQWSVNISPWAPPSLEGKPAQAVLRIDVVVSWPGRSTRQNVKIESLKVANVAYSNYDLQHAIDAAYPR